MKIIVGLGNPDKKYQLTRHNLGFWLIDLLAQRLEAKWQTDKTFQADLIKTPDLWLIKPLTYMNNSGQAVRAILNYYDWLPIDEQGQPMSKADLSDKLVIIHDELDLELGQYKISVNSRSAGHRGVQSIIDALQTQNFTRVRIGIKNNEPTTTPSDKFVLKKFSKTELRTIQDLAPQILANF